jgi:nitrate/nitrite transporter NarK
MQRPDSRLVVALLAAGALSFLAGLAYIEIIDRVPCQGEGLACNIDQAVGGYGVIIFAILGPIIFGLTLLIARNRVALAGAAVVLLLPVIAFFLITQIEHSTTIGVEPYPQFRTFLVTLLPPALTVLLQYLILRLVVSPAGPCGKSGDPEPPTDPHDELSFPTE